MIKIVNQGWYCIRGCFNIIPTRASNFQRTSRGGWNCQHRDVRHQMVILSDRHLSLGDISPILNSTITQRFVFSSFFSLQNNWNGVFSPENHLDRWGHWWQHFLFPFSCLLDPWWNGFCVTRHHLLFSILDLAFSFSPEGFEEEATQEVFVLHLLYALPYCFSDSVFDVNMANLKNPVMRIIFVQWLATCAAGNCVWRISI